MNLSENFTLQELTVTSTGLKNEPNALQQSNLKLLAKNVLQPLRNYLGVAVTVNSGFRSPDVNKAIGGAPTSQHLEGKAADIVAKGRTNEEIIRAIKYLNLPFDQVISEDKGGVKWVHVSHTDGANRGQELVFKDGVYKDVTGSGLFASVVVLLLVGIVLTSK